MTVDWDERVRAHNALHASCLAREERAMSWGSCAAPWQRCSRRRCSLSGWRS